MPKKSRKLEVTERFIVLPINFESPNETESTRFLRRLTAAKSQPLLYAAAGDEETPDGELLEILDSVDLNEAALVKMTPAQAQRLARRYPSLRVNREVRLRPLYATPLAASLRQPRLPKVNALKTLKVTVQSTDGNGPVADAEVVMLIGSDKGVRGRTGADGVWVTALPKSLKRIETVVASPKAGFWAAESAGLKVKDSGETAVTLKVVPIADGHRDGLEIIGAAASSTGAGVKIAVIDAGTDEVSGMKIVRGKNTTGVEDEDEWRDSGSGHGTHVAGVIHRIVPEAELHIYRVFGAGEETAGEVAISKAIRDAVDSGCDIINLSLGQGNEPLSISRETRRARQFGVVCVAAAGNDYMGPVLYPARSSHMLAVSACGADGSWPDGANTHRYVANQPAAVSGVFFAAFSNCGLEMDFIAPGVGTISWVSVPERGVMDGTSMACPVITAKIAGLLATQPALLSADRDQQRSDDIIKLAFAKAKRFGFPDENEGAGYII